MRAARRRDALVSQTLHWLFADAAGLTAPAPRWPGPPRPPADGSAEDPGAERTAALREALTHHRGWTLLARRADRLPGLPAGVVAEARERRRRATLEQLGVESDLAMVAGALDGAGIAWACLKGPLLDAAYRRGGDTRAYGDLDVLVAPGDFSAALGALGRRGTGLRDRNWLLMRERIPGEVDLVTPRRTVIDLHWSLVNQAARRARLHLPTAQLLSRAAPVELGGGHGPVPGLAAPDALAHLCLHAAASGATKLVWLFDVTLSAADPALDWDDLVRTARSWGTARATGLVLTRAAQHLGAPVPREVLRALRGRSGWGTADAVVHRTRAPWAGGAPDAPQHLARGSLEQDSAPVMLLQRARRRVLDPTPRERFVPGPEHPGSALFASGTPDDLGAYLRAVAGQEAS